VKYDRKTAYLGALTGDIRTKPKKPHPKILKVELPDNSVADAAAQDTVDSTLPVSELSLSDAAAYDDFLADMVASR